MLYLISQHFGTRGFQEHHQILQILVEDLKTATTLSGQKGLDKGGSRFATGGDRCSVMYIEKLLSMRLQTSGPLYLWPLTTSTHQGVNKSICLSTMAQDANTSNKRFTNQKNRKLQKAGLTPSKITAITGLDDYIEVDLDEHRSTTARLFEQLW